MFLFYVLSFFKKGDIIQGRKLFKGGHYLRKYGICILHNVIDTYTTYKDITISVFDKEIVSLILYMRGLSCNKHSFQIIYAYKPNPTDAD